MFPRYKGDYYGVFVFEEAKAMVNEGFEVHVVTPHNEGAVFDETRDGIHVHRFKWLEPKPFRALVHFKGFKDNFRLITYFFALFIILIRVIKNHKIDLLHAHSTVPTGLIVAITTKFIRLPFFVTAHGMDINRFVDSFIFTHLIAYALNSSDRTIAVSENLAEKMKSMHVDKNKISVLRNAVDTDRFKPMKNREIRNVYGINEKTLLILFVGYLDDFKGIFELINAFYEIKKENRNTLLMMVGTGPKKSELNERISKLGLENSVILTGKISPIDIHKYYQAADIFVLPSYTEGGGPPLVVLEAMACGVPVIVSDVGGMPEVIKDGENGFVVPVKNEEDLVKKLNVLINNTKLRENFKKNSYKLVEKEFSQYKKMQRLIELYQLVFNDN